MTPGRWSELTRPLNGQRGAPPGLAGQPNHSTACNTIAFDCIPDRVGSVLGTSDWIPVSQQRINGFADATDDHQWLHQDDEQAAAGPFGETVAQGMLTLALMPALAQAAWTIQPAELAIHYGFNRVRFPAPVPSGARVRATFTLQSCVPLPGNGWQLDLGVQMDCDRTERPVCIAEWIVHVYREALPGLR